MPLTDRELFARLIKCEAGGEGIDGMKAVANTVMNRVHVGTGQYLRTGEGSLRKVITDPGEFTCMLSTVYGQVNPQTVWTVSPEQIHYDIADWALGGNKMQGTDNCLWYYNPFMPACESYFPSRAGVIHNRIGEHCFYSPTALYAQT